MLREAIRKTETRRTGLLLAAATAVISGFAVFTNGYAEPWIYPSKSLPLVRCRSCRMKTRARPPSVAPPTTGSELRAAAI